MLLSPFPFFVLYCLGQKIRRILSLSETPHGVSEELQPAGLGWMAGGIQQDSAKQGEKE
jgi:hypothetical protein